MEVPNKCEVFLDESLAMEMKRYSPDGPQIKKVIVLELTNERGYFYYEIPTDGLRQVSYNSETFTNYMNKKEI